MKKIIHFSFLGSLFILLIMLAACGTRKENKAELEKMDEEAGDKIVSVELSDEAYKLEYAFYHTGWWEKDIFYAYSDAVSHKKIYFGTIEKEVVAQLLQALDLREKNLQEKLVVQEAEDGNTYYNNSEIRGLGSFLLYGEDTEEAILIVTKTGEIYLQGVHYTGDKTAFKEAFSKFIQEETADEEEQQEKFMGFVDEIEWE